jgi:hypothetical protein
VRLLFVVALAACDRDPQPGATALCGTDAAVDASPDAPPSVRGLVLIAGQSNAVGQGDPLEADPSWSAPFPAVTLSTRTGKNAADPPVVTTTEGALAPHPKFGAELSLGRQMPDHDIAICAGNGFNLAVNWDPNGAYPAGQPNWYTQCAAWIHDVEVAHGTRVDTILWFQGESDTTVQAYAQAYGDNLLEIADRFLSEFPCARFFYYRLKTPGTYVDLVRAGQDAAAAADPRLREVRVDALPTFGQHFTSDGYLQLGELFAGVAAATPSRCP